MWGYQGCCWVRKSSKGISLYVFTSILTSLSEAAFAWMWVKKLWRCWFRGTGTRFSSHRGVSQHFADAVVRHIFLEAGLEVRCAKFINVTIFLGENKRHIYGSAHDFVWSRVCRSWSSPSKCTYSNMPEFGRTVWFLWSTSDRKWCK